MGICFKHNVCQPDDFIHSITEQGLCLTVAFHPEMGPCVLVGGIAGKRQTPDNEEGQGVTLFLLKQETAEGLAQELLCASRVLDIMQTLCGGPTQYDDPRSALEEAKRVWDGLQRVAVSYEKANDLHIWTGVLADVTDKEVGSEQDATIFRYGGNDSHGSHGDGDRAGGDED